MKRRGLATKLIAPLVLLAALALGGCSTTTGSSTGSDDEYTVGVTFPDLGNPVWAAIIKEGEAYGAESGIKMTYVDAQNDAAKQVTQIENFIQSGVDAIIICAVESNAIAEVTKKAQDAGIRIIGFTQGLENYDTQLLVDSYNTGYANGEAAANWITDTFGDEPVEWALMDLPTFPEIIERADGIKDAVAELAPNAKLVATAPALTTEDGAANAESFLQAHPDIKMIATIGGGGASGANAGAKSAGITDFSEFGIFGIDATELEIQAILDGGPQVASVSLGGGAKELGRTLIDMTLSVLAGDDVEKDQYQVIKVIDETNAQEFYDEVYGG